MAVSKTNCTAGGLKVRQGGSGFVFDHVLSLPRKNRRAGQTKNSSVAFAHFCSSARLYVYLHH